MDSLVFAGRTVQIEKKTIALYQGHEQSVHVDYWFTHKFPRSAHYCDPPSGSICHRVNIVPCLPEIRICRNGVSKGGRTVCRIVSFTFELVLVGFLPEQMRVLSELSRFDINAPDGHNRTVICQFHNSVEILTVDFDTPAVPTNPNKPDVKAPKQHYYNLVVSGNIGGIPGSVFIDFDMTMSVVSLDILITTATICRGDECHCYILNADDVNKPESSIEYKCEYVLLGPDGHGG
jgi:hypothetical protein